ncbi:MAG: hypothetical protein KIH10_06110, partial [Candidatus Freyarchaeota archaeon]|nr:hypothetical protein [Candidatus Jordarchaeia archaeon]
MCLYLLDIFISLKNWELGDKKPRKPTKGFPNPRKMGLKEAEFGRNIGTVNLESPITGRVVYSSSFINRHGDLFGFIFPTHQRSPRKPGDTRIKQKLKTWSGELPCPNCGSPSRKN